MALVKVKNFPGRIFAEQAQQLLEREGIPSVVKSPDAGVFGSTGTVLPQGADLYVPEEFAEKAREVVLALFDGI
uniref:DUF2007 domain-containing protein n=1 Tax=Ammonifex degensii TaxID=42838 RepID=A0A7C1F3F9_9THEO